MVIIRFTLFSAFILAILLLLFGTGTTTRLFGAGNIFTGSEFAVVRFFFTYLIIIIIFIIAIIIIILFFLIIIIILT